MKRNIIFTIIISSVLVLIIGIYTTGNLYSADKNEIKWGSFDKGIAVSKSSNKKMVIDVYTDWCGWCKKMDKNTYGDPDVQDYINKYFVAIKLNAESGTKMSYQGKIYSEQQLAQGFGITGYPATIFFDENQKPITVIPGYLEGKQFLDILKFIKEDIYKTKSFDEYLKTKKID